MTQDDYPEFHLKLPYDGPLATGRLLPEKGTNGSQQFVVLASSPVRSEVVPSFASHFHASHRLREQLIADGMINASTKHPDHLEFSQDYTFGSPSAAAGVILGSSVNGYTSWQTAEERPLGDFLAVPPWGPSARGWCAARTSSGRTWFSVSGCGRES
ncbi:protein of unknown function [Actinopolyspora alba]|uniref:DUF4357 domain-containing protein n=1 Tax=Actinopolyspora alba TaxID=673379 RepID=A0A1I1YUV6_9ACTN|nr:DUF4357 domain-containing protein [Actinopolyspora alba]SFE23092.1 protein of unknown function [Actinopolyspora alba]